MHCAAQQPELGTGRWRESEKGTNVEDVGIFSVLELHNSVSK